MMYTLSWHQEGEKKVDQAHSRREPHAIGKDSSIDSRLTPNNITLVDVPIREAYHKLFDNAVSEYNSRARQSRQIRNYYTQIGKTNKQQAYESIVQIGSKSEGSPAKAIEAFKQYVTDWKKRNPNMVLIGAYIHMDETTPHMHLDYIPVARCNRGMKIQNSLTRALASQGFKTAKQNGKQVTAQQQWEQSERDCMREICENLGIELHKQGIGKKRHLSVKEYKDCQDQIKQVKGELSILEGKKLNAEFKQQELLYNNKQLESKKLDLQKQVDTKKQALTDIEDELDSADEELADIKQSIADLSRNNQWAINIYHATAQVDEAVGKLWDLLETDEQRQAVQGIYDALDNIYELYQDSQYIDYNDEMEL